MLLLYFLVFISSICCFPLFNTQKSFDCHPSIQVDLDTSQEVLSNNNIPLHYGYIYDIDTSNKIKADILVQHPFSNKEEENATLVLTRIEYRSDSIRLFGRPSKSNLHHFQSISVMKSIRFGTYSMSAKKWFHRMNAYRISTKLISIHIKGPDVELVLAPVRSWKNEHIEFKEEGATKQRFIWSGPSKLKCNSLHDRFDEMMDSAILF